MIRCAPRGVDGRARGTVTAVGADASEPRRAGTRTFVRRGAHLAALAALALAQPLFDILSRFPEFFAIRGSSGREIILFAAAIVLVPPLVLLTIEFVAELVRPELGRAVHLVFVGALAALLALHVAIRATDLSGAVALALAAVLGALVVAAYARTQLVPSLLSVAALAPIAFIGLFLFTDPISKLAFPERVRIETRNVDARTPVVLIVFDELSTVSLMNSRQQLDAERFPAFGRLARDGIWFRNATTVHPHTEVAVPAILTGNAPREAQLPVLADHPHNLFTLLGRGYRMNVVEPLTKLCPAELCRGENAAPAAATASVDDDVSTLASDAAIVYAHLVVPKPYAERLPPITDAWTNFGRAAETGTEATSGCARGFCELIAGIGGGSARPSLNFLHTLLPHVPWLHLPSGQRYTGDVRRIPGIVDGRWTDDEALAVQGYQRHLLQLGYTDRAVGAVLDRLDAAGLYDRALIVLTADHGVSFEPGQPRRLVTAANLDDIAFVPLLVKLPRQQRGRIDDRRARIIDVLPTIADALDVRPQRRVDGRSLLRAARPNRGMLVIRSHGTTVSASLPELVRRRAADARRQVMYFGEGAFDRVYAAGPFPRLVGTPLADASVIRASGASVEVHGASLIGAVDPKAVAVPAYLTGRVRGVAVGTALAVAVNGKVAAVTRAYSGLGETRFGAIVSPASFRGGSNEVRVLEVRRAGRTMRLADLGGTARTYRLIGTRVVSSTGDAFVVERGAIDGTVRVRPRGRRVMIGGWAVATRARRPAETILVVVGNRSVFSGAPNYERRESVQRYGVEDAGFLFEVPSTLVRNVDRVRIFALARGVASELPRQR